MISTRLISIGLGYIFGIICASFLPTHKEFFLYIFWTFLVLGTATAVWALFREFKWKENHILVRTIPILIASFAAGNLITNNFLHSDNPGTVFFKSLPDKSEVIMRGIITSETETRSDSRLDVRFRTNELKKPSDKDWTKINSPIDINLNVNYPPDDKEQQDICAKIASPDSYGYQIEVSGTFNRSSESPNPGGFDYEAFLMSEGYTALLKVFDRNTGDNNYIKIIEEKKGNPLVEFALIAKKSFMRTIQRTIPPPESFFVSGATLGTRFSIKKQEYRGKFIENSFRHSGVGHVLAVSGLHVSVVSLLLYSLLRMTRLSPKYFTPVLIVLLFAFAFLTGARPSSLRATIMNSLVLISFVYGGGGISKSAYTGLAFSSFLILLQRPMALYSAGFLLSFGAVLSLVMLTTPFDKLLRSLRGGRLIGAIIWFALSLFTICTAWDIFLRWESIALFAILFYILLELGEALNKFFPALLFLNPDKLPTMGRIFLAAQIGIQVGMMIPLSSFFFGQMPIAGIFVNMIAIPLIGVIVQLGLLAGIFGAIPFVGEYIALVLGAANFLASKLFIWVAHLGTEILPFPVTPIPKVSWIIYYYVIIAIFASSGLWIRNLQTIIYKVHHRAPLFVSKLLPICLLIALASFAIARHKSTFSSEAEIHILAGTGTPTICITENDHRKGATLINGGHSFFAKSSLKNFLLKKNNITIDTLFVGGHAPEFGSSTIAELANYFHIRKVYYPNFHNPTESKSPPAFDSMEEFFNAIGEDKIFKSASDAKAWALRYFESYTHIVDAWRPEWVIFTPPAEFILNNGAKLEYLKTVYRSYPLVISLSFENKKILLLPDGNSTKKIPKDKLKCDILVLGGPTKANYRTYIKSLQYLLTDASPNTLILCVDNNFFDKDISQTVEKTSDICAIKVDKFLRTDETGAVSIQINNNKLSEKIKFHLAK